MDEPEETWVDCVLCSGVPGWGLLSGRPPPASEKGPRRGMGGRERVCLWGPQSRGGRTSMRLKGVCGRAGNEMSPAERGGRLTGAERGRGRLRGEGGRERGENGSGLLVLRLQVSGCRSAEEPGACISCLPGPLESRATSGDSEVRPSSLLFTSGGPPGPPGPSPGLGRAGDLGSPQSSPSAREAFPSARSQPLRSSNVSAART